MNLGARILARLEALGLSQAELARRVGITQPSINHLIKRGAGGSSHLHKIARELATTPAYLNGETDDPSADAIPLPTPESIAQQLDMVAISEINLEFGMGATFTDLPVETRVLHFPREWVESITSSPASMLLIARGRGDSMMPTLLDGDMVLIDRAQRTIREQDAIWAITMGDVGMIKRVRARPRGSYAILSDNPSVPPDQADDGEMHVVGRVVFIGRRT